MYFLYSIDNLSDTAIGLRMVHKQLFYTNNNLQKKFNHECAPCLENIASEEPSYKGH